jgi:hypothetical protein
MPSRRSTRRRLLRATAGGHRRELGPAAERRATTGGWPAPPLSHGLATTMLSCRGELDEGEGRRERGRLGGGGRTIVSGCMWRGCGR